MSQDLRVILDRFGEAVDKASREWVKASLERIKIEVEKVWPDHPPVHPYGKDRSVKQWRVELAADGMSGRVYNEADYSGYVELGYTTKGKGTARPYKGLGKLPYLRGHALTPALLAELRADFVARIQEALRG